MHPYLHAGSLSRRASPGPSPHIRASPSSSTHGHESEHSAAVSGRPTFKVNLAQPPRFTKITVTSDVASWLHKVARVCRLAGYPISDWTMFASTLLEGTPQTLFDAAEQVAMKHSDAAHAQFLEWSPFKDWCETNLNLVNHSDHAKIAIAAWKQTGTVASYKAAFDALVARAGNEGMHLFWWYQSLKPALQTATAIDPRTNSAFTNLADAQHNAITVEGVKMAAPTGAVDSAGTAEGYKGKHHQPKPPSTQSRPATTTRFNKGGPSSFNHKGTAPTPAVDRPLAMVNYMRSFGKEPAPIPEALAKPPDRRVPGRCWVKGCFGINHSRWQECPRTAQFFNSTAMDTVSPPRNVSLHRTNSNAQPPPPPAQRR